MLVYKREISFNLASHFSRENEKVSRFDTKLMTFSDKVLNGKKIGSAENCTISHPTDLVNSSVFSVNVLKSYGHRLEMISFPMSNKV